MALSDEVPGCRCTIILACAAVWFTTLLTLILPFSCALIIEVISEDVVLPKGSSVIDRVFESILSILARTFTAPPRSPSLYRDTSMNPPVWKSGYRLKLSPLRHAIAASHISPKLCGSIFEDSPTAIPSAPCASSKGNFIGSVTGSFFRPS